MQRGVVDDSHNCLQSNVTFSNTCMPVFMRALNVQAIVEMNGLKSSEPNELIKVFQYGVKIIHYIITSIKDMTGVETDAHFISKLYLIQDRSQFLEGPTHCAPFACHRFQQNGRRLF